MAGLYQGPATGVASTPELRGIMPSMLARGTKTPTTATSAAARNAMGLGVSWLALGIATAAACRPTPASDPTTQPAPAPATEPVADARGGDLPPTPPPDEVTALLAAVDAAQVMDTVTSLAGFGTRHTLSEDTETRGIGAARRWIHARLSAAGPRLDVSFDSHPMGPDGRRIDRPVAVVNVVAILPGTMPEATARHYYVIGHYDSRASDPMDAEGDAPGANDDASGVAVVLELARVLADQSLDSTVVFMATAGEEQGLLGARAHAEASVAAGTDIRAVLSNDIVGDPTAPDGSRNDTHVRLFSEGLPAWIDDAQLQRLRTLSGTSDGPSRQLARTIDAVARWHGLPVRPRLILRHDRFLRGGDHTAFNAMGVAAVRFTEVGEHYDRQHQDPRTEGDRRFGDAPEFVDRDYLAGVARLNLAALVHLANAPSTPADARMVATALAIDTTLQWSRAPEPDVAGYEIVWRATTEAQWTHAQDVGDVTEATLPLHKDDYFFGVRAYDADGYRSPVAFPAVVRS
ncbi:MAG: M20/M25/M40 family metallo-hydrolase [Myxococcota bacterium]